MRLETAVRRQLRIWFQSALFPWPELIVLIRHAESIGNRASWRVRNGLLEDLPPEILTTRNMDIPLTLDRGEPQAILTGEWLKLVIPEFDHIFVSPYKRPIRTAELIFPDWHDFEIDERIREIDFGFLDGLSLKARKKVYADAERSMKLNGKYYGKRPNGENIPDMLIRARMFLSMLHREHCGERIAIVCHADMIGAFRCALEHLTEQQYLDYDKNRPIENASVLIYREYKNANGKSKLAPFNGRPFVPWMGKVCERS